MNERTIKYLRRNGVSDETLSALQQGEVLGVTAEIFSSWIVGAFKDGQSHSKRSLAAALLPQVEALVRAAQEIGRQEGFQRGYDANKAELLSAEAQADRFSDRLSKLATFESSHAQHQAIVADCLLWFDGFNASFAGREPWERPNTPDRNKLRALNSALQRLGNAEDDQEILF